MTTDALAGEMFDRGAIATALNVSKRFVAMRAVREQWPYVEEDTQGGKRRLYALSSLPDAVATALRLRYCPAPVPVAAGDPCAVMPSVPALDSAGVWDRYARSRQSAKDEAGTRLKAVLRVCALMQAGVKRMAAREQVAGEMRAEGVKGATAVSLARWLKAVDGQPRSDWLPLLLPGHRGPAHPVLKEIDSELWALFVADYLRLEKPSLAGCHERLQRIAQAQGKTIPSRDTFERRVKRVFSRQALVLEREGKEAFDRTIPSLQRDHAVFHAMEAVNADGHTADVFVCWPEPLSNGKTISRPLLLGVQDIYSGLILGWRVCASETALLAQRTFHEVIQRYGIPAKVWMDNGKAFACKELTGGVETRFRFKVKADEPLGALHVLGCDVRWTQPYRGQSKPIERAWRDLCDRVAKHPAFAGAYTGNRPNAKPENYQSRAVPIAEFLRVLEAEIREHNARRGRRSAVCEGVLSFQEAFDASYAAARDQVRRASEEQLRMLLQATVVVNANRENGLLTVAGNRYYNDLTAPLAGQKVQVRFDPDALHAGVEVYRLSGEYVGFVECRQKVGFADLEASKAHSKLKNAERDLVRRQKALQTQLDEADVAQQLAGLGLEGTPPDVLAPILGKRQRRAQARERVREAAVLPAPAPEAAAVIRRRQDYMKELERKRLNDLAWVDRRAVG